MIHYTFSCLSPTSQFVQIEINIDIRIPNSIKLQLPAWRAGRYQIANYAQNIRSFSVFDSDNQAVFWEKSTKDSWVFKVAEPGIYRIRYEFYAAKMDAGSSWVDDQQVYLNLVNCCFEVKGTTRMDYLFQFNFPKFPQVACTLPLSSTGEYLAEDFQQVADSTFLAAQKLTHWKIRLGDIPIHCWIHGEVVFDLDEFLTSIQALMEVQVQDFGSFPEKEYHFIYQLLPYPHFHGVEHRRGTVITFGPAQNLAEQKAMKDLLAVSSHEFYHAWNVCSIRPKELLPYNFSKESYTKSGWILEGITSYLGDWYMLQAGLYSTQEFVEEMEKTINRVSRDLGWKNESILASSFDLWLDGYQAGIPNKKQNIYANGALIAWALDIHLRRFESSLPEVMKQAFERFGRKNKSYQEGSFWLLVSRAALSWDSVDFYQKFIAGKESIVEELKKILPLMGFVLEERPNEDMLTRSLGIILQKNTIERIHPTSPAYTQLMIGDEIKSVEQKSGITLSISRINGQTLDFSFEDRGDNFYPNYKISVSEQEAEELA
ncbi:M61 family peptidase [Algoriphagus sp.]|uniref:M61 family metallopeptidase n=1 Tax=Algoriphagus sp. TaxID=1872435 RepID=UPI00262820DE|nr:M61 family peptidase [Algoriphagus sp.]